MPPAPVRHRQRKPGQQHVVDAAMERRRHPRQQRLRHRRQAASASDARRVPSVSRAGSSRSADQQQRRLASASRARTKAPAQRFAPAHAPQAAPPSPGTTSPAAAAQPPARPRSPARPPQGPAPGSATTPRRPQDDGSQATAARPLRPGIEPHRLHHHAGRRTEPPLRGFRLRGDQLAQRRVIVDDRQHRSAAGRRRPQPHRAASPQAAIPPVRASGAHRVSRSRSAS